MSSETVVVRMFVTGEEYTEELCGSLVFNGTLTTCEGCGDGVPNCFEDEDGFSLCLTCFDKACRNGDLKVVRLAS